MDDIIILAQTKKQYQRAKKTLYSVLKDLKLELSSSKTKMGRIESSFHFLGGQFEVTRISQTKLQVSVSVHSRTCARALDRVKVLQEDAVHPAKKQRYLIRWAAWWRHTLASDRILSIVLAWVVFAMVRDPTIAWLGRGLLPWRMLQTIDNN